MGDIINYTQFKTGMAILPHGTPPIGAHYIMLFLILLYVIGTNKKKTYNA